MAVEGKTLEVVIICDGEEVHNGDIEDWFKANGDEREYLEGICEFVLKGVTKEVIFSEISGDWHVKVKE